MIKAEEIRKIEEMREFMINKGFYKLEDINRICYIERLYIEECNDISLKLEEEDKPSHGVDYELQCEESRIFYDLLLKEIDKRYEM